MRHVTVRALIDQGSQMTLITEGLAQMLRAKRLRTPISVSAVGGVNAGTFRHATKIFIAPRDRTAPIFVTTALILTALTSYLPKRNASLTLLSHLADLSLADTDPMGAEPISILIGADLYGAIILDGVRKGEAGQPIAQNSALGWIISGPLPATEEATRANAHSSEVVCSSTTIHTHNAVGHTSLEEELRRFWEVEELPRTAPLSPHDEKCEQYFSATHSRDSDGRYIVRLPFKAGPPIEIGKSRSRADTVLNSVTRRLRANPTVAKEYSDFLSEYEQLGHMRRAPVPLDHRDTSQDVYIPHHAVIRESSTTTRLRVVFNASSVTSNGSSLNDHLLAGPKLQNEITSVILQWRRHRFVYTADITKMYRQIRVDERDVNYQRIRWQGEKTDQLIDYQLLTVTYGTACAPFLALRVVKQLADDEARNYPMAAPVLRDNIYVDDVLFGADDETTARQTRDQLIALLNRGGFELRKWASNSIHLTSDIDAANHGLASEKLFASDESIKILGIGWNPLHDVFKFRVEIAEVVPRSKREILSAIAKFYDPLGWVTPVTISAKIFMQQLWRSKIGWDDAISDALRSNWETMYSKLSCLNDIQIPRWSGLASEIKSAEIHGFADASNVAYAAVVFLKVTSCLGEVNITLLAGKAKVAPLKPLSIPRLELSAAVLLSRLLEFVRKSNGWEDYPYHCWTDSTVVLAWVTQHPSRWKTFVANRVNEIQSRLPDGGWRHVSTKENPADCASRGMFGDEIVDHRLWWEGPPWLRLPSTEWPRDDTTLPPNADLEEKICVLQCSQPPAIWTLATRYSSWPKLIRVTAYVLRFCRLCRRDNTIQASIVSQSAAPNGIALTAAECNDVRTFWIKQIQAELFRDEITALAKKQHLSGKSPLCPLNPFLDSDGVLRVGGRLKNAPAPFAVRHPIILSSHSLVRLIISQAHVRTLHAGPQLILNVLRRDFWIIRARSLVKSVVHNCVACARERAATPAQIMGDLPAARVSPSSRAFVHCGLDYAGPVNIRASGGRGITSRKAYIALFVCLATKAVHLELVGDYSTAAFLNSYSRFCARRGLPQAMYSDNGTTFTGADRELTLAYKATLRDPNFLNKTAADNVEWNFIPPSAPHFGGLWEAGIRSVKHHLRRVLGNHTLTFEEFSTLLCRIEACLNSRPLAPLTDELSEYDYLTPGHFLIGSAVTVNPEPTLLHLNENRLSRWQVLRHITERFWKIWCTDYVNTLQQRAKWRTSKPSLKIGQLVLLRNATLPPCKWELGRVTACHPGSDGCVRVVTVKTAISEYKRPIVKLCVLPIECEAASS